MKIKLRFVNGLVHSPLLTLDSYWSTRNSFDKKLKKFLQDLNETDPNKAMVNFIIAAGKDVGSGINPSSISNSPAADDSDVINITIRKPDIAEFVYHKDDGSSSWRKVDVLEEDKYYIKGNDVEDDLKFKCFKKALIVGGRIMRQSKS